MRHAARRLPHPGPGWLASDVNFALNRFDMVVVDESSLISPASFNIVAGTLNRLNCHPVVVIAGNRRQQEPLQTVQGRVSNTVSILNDQTFSQENAVKHSLYQKFRIVDKEYKAFVEMVRYQQPTQRQLDQFQQDLVLCPAGCLADEDIYRAFSRQAQTSIMTVSRAAAQRINGIVVEKLFAGKQPLSNVPCAQVAGGPPILPYAGRPLPYAAHAGLATDTGEGLKVFCPVCWIAFFGASAMNTLQPSLFLQLLQLCRLPWDDVAKYCISIAFHQVFIELCMQPDAHIFTPPSAMNCACKSL